MEFSSLSFLIFLSFTLVAYWSVAARYQWLILLLASGYFYFSWQPAYGGIIFVSTLVTYLVANQMYLHRTAKNFFLCVALIFTIGILFVCKYYNFFSLTISQLAFIKLPHIEVLLPIGISFYTFQMLGYLFDVYQGRIKPEKHLGRFALFILFFPKLISGPIEKSKHFLPQLLEKHTWQSQQIKSGLKLFAFGLFKKLVIADNLALVVNRGFGSLEEYKGLSLILIVVLYSWQIFADFSGYTDMARGIARLFGYNLMENFNTPYFATSIRDFWRRWHISLSSWLQEYLYFPLGGSRVPLWRVCSNYLIVFIVCGIWHGATWNFVLWGVLHGMYIAGERVVGSLTKGRIKLPKMISILYTYSLVCISWVLFRAENVKEATYIYINSLEGLKNFINPNYIWATVYRLFLTNKVEMAIAMSALASIIIIEYISSQQPIGKILRKQPLMVRLAVYTLLVTSIILFRNVGVTEFIYIQF